ncbi:MAG: ABC transporter ATP-binding protein [Caldilineaceae bacterium]|nr:ABC transporter ATP-binding protein [Caldilineaceae bacterium]
MAEIQLVNVRRRFTAPPSGGSPFARANQSFTGPVAALDGVTLTIPNGKTCAVIGPSGCGKSTLLRVIAGLDADYEGDVRYTGEDVRHLAPGDRNIGMVFQNYALYPHFHGENNLRFFFRVRKAPDAEAEERIRITAEIMGVGFNELLQHKPGILSGGQQQRLAIGRALVRSPQLFLFDEPLSNLDAKLRTQTRIEIKRLLNRFAITAVYVTHDQEEAMALGDQIAVMRAGRIEQVGNYADLRAAPANAFVAGFLGRFPMNLLERVDASGALRTLPATLPIPRDRPLIVGVWPEDLALNTGSSPGVHLAGIVDHLEVDYSRRIQYVRVRTDAGPLTVADAANLRLAEGERVTVELPGNRLFFFDAESEECVGRSA